MLPMAFHRSIREIYNMSRKINTTLSALSVSMFSAYSAALDVEKASGKARAAERAAAKTLWESLDADALTAFSEDPASIKGWLSDKYLEIGRELGMRVKNATAWKNTKAAVSGLFLIHLEQDRPVKVERTAKADDGKAEKIEKEVPALSVIGNVHEERAAAQQIRDALGIGNKRAARAAEQPKADAAESSAKTFAQDVSGAKAWLTALLAMPSGFGILDQALRARGYYIARIGTTSPLIEEPKVAKPKVAKPKAVEQPTA
jgi:uncharacterized alpha-E superfamily protein